MSKISIEFEKDMWMYIVEKMLDSKVPFLLATTGTIIAAIIKHEKTEEVKEKANL